MCGWLLEKRHIYSGVKLGDMCEMPRRLMFSLDKNQNGEVGSSGTGRREQP